MSYKNFIYNLLPYRIKREVKELFASTILVNFALAMVLIFEPIYLYQIGYSLKEIMVFYLLTYVVYFFIMPLGAKFAHSKGYELGIFFGTALFMVFYTSLFLIDLYPWLFYVAPIIFAVQKMFYWPAYHADFADFSDDQEEGREVSSITILTSLAYILGPILAGFIISIWGYGALFITVSLIFLLSNVPTLITKEKVVKKFFSYTGAYQYLLDKKNRRVALSFLGFGEEFVSMVIWPIFIYVIIENVFDLGLIVGLSILITSLITLYIGRLSDFANRRKILGWGASFYAFSWFFRMFITSQFGVFFVNSFAQLARNVIGVPMMAIIYEESRRHHTMHKIVLFEMSLVVGKILTMLAIYLLLTFVVGDIFAMKLIFIFAGAISLLYLLL